MPYRLGVDLGTSWVAAAIHRDGDAPEIVPLGTRAPVIPSAVFMTEDGSVLVGEAALRRGATDPTRLASSKTSRTRASSPMTRIRARGPIVLLVTCGPPLPQ